MGRKSKKDESKRELNCKEILTVEEAAELLQLRKETILRYISAGKLIASRIGRPWRIRKVDLNSFLIMHENKAITP